MTNIEKSNFDFLDLYGDSLKPYVLLDADSKLIDIVNIVNTNNSIGYKHQILVGGRPIIAVRKFTWRRRVAITSYIHIYEVSDFNNPKIIQHWREQKDGCFKKIK